MEKRIPENYQVEDFVTDDSFINYHFQLNYDDQVFWEKWINEHPGYSSIAKTAQEFLQTLTLSLPEKEFGEELAKIKKAIHYNEVFKSGKPTPVVSFDPGYAKLSFKNRSKRLIKFLLPVLLIIFVGGYFIYQHFTGLDSTLVEKYNHSSAPIVFTLSDSTVVTLAPQSLLRYPGRFGPADRVVYLEGEAQFHVKADVAHPFKVKSGEIVATVLGTIFNVKQQGDSLVEVELLKGKLKVEAIDSAGVSLQSVMLKPAERVVYNRHDKNLQKETWQSNNDKVIVAAHLQFRQDNFETIARQLETVFKVTIINLSDKKDWRFTGEFKNSTVKEIVENICIIKNLSYQVQGDTIFIK